MTSLGDRLKIARQKRGFKQVDVRERANINNKTLSGYENNVSEPDRNTLITLAKLYEVSYEWLLTGEGIMDSSNHSEKTLSEKEEKNIVNDLQKILDGLDGGFAAYYGKTPEEIEDQELLKASLEQAMRLAKRVAKDKFTPKKYK